MSATEQTIATLRAQIAGLLSQIDTTAKPRPTVVTQHPEPSPGAAWHPVRNWTVRTIDDDLVEPRHVYVTCPEHGRSGAAADFDALTSDDARRLAMALLAAADWADGLAADVTPLDARRTGTSRTEASQ
ncbi:hypothetical protein GCM10023085_45810 [Actinomadura viridis]|uniref:Uncharacterized protein n=1 Tax=Actinomadura viridis TaxID=58110 RepID=A0A931DLT0_9ACTN|nr:hypothetical protein [Actinomadura viridis]MBG6089941.1 hypothetical protein [Actinomadura viridis]